MKALFLSLILFFSFNSFSGEGSSIGGGNHINRLVINDIELDSILIPNTGVTAVSVGRTTYKKLNSNHNEFSLVEGQGFLIDLSKVDSIDTDNGILNLDGFRSNLGTQLLIDEKSKIRDIFTKDGELIIFN